MASFVMQSRLSQGLIYDGIDNDCNPQTPDGSGDEQVGEACDTGADGACSRSVYICQNGRLECPSPAGNDEVCDDVDNDCDGNVDEGPANQECGPLADGCRNGECQCGMDNPCNERLSDRCNNGVCQCGGEDECDPDKADRCVNGVCQCGQGNACDRGDECSNGECVND